MLPRMKFSASALILTLALIPGLPKWVSALDEVQRVYNVVPNSVIPGQEFKLSVQGGPWGCGTTFSNERVKVVGKRIDLSFVATNRLAYPLSSKEAAVSPTVICAYDQMAIDIPRPIPPIGSWPTFSIPALEYGEYEVWVTDAPECWPTCKILVHTQYAGLLKVYHPLGAIRYSINPTQISPSQDFTLNLLSYEFTCGTTYEMLSSTVEGNLISLNFLDRETPAAICPAIYKPYGPSFKLKGLKAGTYNVKVYRLPACMAQGCTVAPQAVSAGNLEVTDPTAGKSGWFLAEKRVALSSGTHPLQLLNNKYGNCQTRFSNLSASVNAGGIYVNFSIDTHPENICITNISPYGPTFQLIAPIKAGAYPIFVHEIAACELTKPYCLAGIQPKAIDTLYISSTNSILNPTLGSANPKAAFHGNMLNLKLPGNSEIGMDRRSSRSQKVQWKIELMTLSGRVLLTEKVEVDGMQGGNVSIESRSRDQRGMYLLRLTSSNSQTHSLPVIDKE